MNDSPHYDVAIIGAGMSGLAAGIRLAHFGKKVGIFERHNAVGGLNGFYSFAGRKFDVGLHAMTNFVRSGVKGTPLTKLLRQLRIERDEFALCEQKQSRITFGPRAEISLRFTNDFAVFESEVARAFPRQVDGFRQLVAVIKAYDDVALTAQPESARTVVRRFLSDAVLEDMLFCPVMYYGSATAHDMDFGQFVIMFKALLLEGFARPFDGVRVILRVLQEKYRQAGGARRMKCGVRRIVIRDGRAGVLVLDTGEEITADHIISSIGSPETHALIEAGRPGATTANPALTPAPGQHSFIETITVFDRQPAAFGWGDDTIVFFNDSARFEYACPTNAVDTRSGVICIPNNFDFGPGRNLPEGVVRVTCLARPAPWFAFNDADYAAAKAHWFSVVQQCTRPFLPPADQAAIKAAVLTTDMFTPRTIAKFTGHLNGAIYGAPVKIRDGRTAWSNLYICGTDQGFLGIVGAMLSGISMANYHILQKK
jgi:phytoene dehydrogenase-like protein